MTTVVGDCLICADPTGHPQAYACPRCRRMLNRIETRKDASGAARKPIREARIQALKESWNHHERVFRCHYTGIVLNTEDSRDHRYWSWEHQTPGDENEVVVVSMLINRMKTDLSDSEFRRLVSALAKSFDNEPFDETAFPDRPFRPS